MEGLYMKNVQNFLHLYDNNRLIIIGLNEMLPGHHTRVFRTFLLRKFMLTGLEIVLKFQQKSFSFIQYIYVYDIKKSVSYLFFELD